MDIGLAIVLSLVKALIVVPVFIVKVPVPNAALLSMFMVPAESVIPPEKVFAPESVSAPASVLISDPLVLLPQLPVNFKVVVELLG